MNSKNYNIIRDTLRFIADYIIDAIKKGLHVYRDIDRLESEISEIKEKLEL